MRVIALTAEICYYPSQQSDPDLWIYFSGIAVAYIHPMSWGKISLVGMPGISYANEKFSITVLTMVNLGINLN